MSFRTGYLTFFALGPWVALGLIFAEKSLSGGDGFDQFMRASSLGIGAWLGLWVFGWLMILVDVWRNPRMPREKRKLWTVVITIGNFYSLPIYWWHYVRGSGPNQNVEPAPNTLFQADPNPRERGSGPLNSDR